MGSICGNCNEKTGLLTNWRHGCLLCNKQVCTKCAPWGIKILTTIWKRMNNIKHKWYSENELIEKYLCSEECAFEIYRKFIDSFEEKEIVISHVFNMDIQIIDMKSEQDVYLHLSGHLTNAYFKKYGKDKLLEPGAVIIPESQPLYIRIKEDAIKRGFTLDNSLFF